MPKILIHFLTALTFTFFLQSCRKDKIVYSSPTDTDSTLLSGEDCNSFVRVFPNNNYANYEKMSLSSIVESPDGGFVMIGSLRNDGYDPHKLFVNKVDCFGSLMWTDTFNMHEHHFLNEIIQTNGGYLISSVHGGGLWWGEVRTGKLIKMDENGSVMWSTEYHIGTPAPTFSIDRLLKTSNGGYLTCGKVWESGYLSKFNYLGQQDWFWEFETGTYIYDVAENSNQEYLLCGQTIVNNDYDEFLAKVNSMGDTIWTKTIYNANTDNRALSVITTNNGEFFVGGINHIVASPSYSYVTKYDSSANQLWSRSFENEELTNLKQIEFTSDGNIFCHSTNSAGQLTIMKLHENTGNTIWMVEKDFSRNTSDIKPTTDGGFILTGSYHTEEIENSELMIKVNSSGK